VANKVVLIAADEKISQRLGIGLNFYAERLRDLACAIAQIGVVETEHGKELQGHDRKKHINVDVGDDRLPRDGGMTAKYFEPSRPFSSPVTRTNRIDRRSFRDFS